VAKKASPDDFTIEELRRMLVEKRRASRQERLERFRRTGRVIVVAPDSEGTALADLRTGTVTESPGSLVSSPTRSRRKRLLDGLLLVVEILAVIGLLFVLFNGVSLIRTLNKEVAAALVQPTLTPTPLIVAVVLPSGHTPPNSPGGAQPNEAEIPNHLRPLVQSLANIPIPTPGPEQAIRIQIPALGVDGPIVQGDGWEQLKKGVGQHIGTGDPGEEGNLVLSAHNDIFGEIFRDLDRLKPGDEVILYTNQHAYSYVVSGSKIVEPTEVEVMAPTRQPVVTLISCYPYMVDDQRIVVTAQLQSEIN
jgi:sortase A